MHGTTVFLTGIHVYVGMQFDIRQCSPALAAIARQQRSALAREAGHLQAVQGSPSIVPLAAVLVQEAVGGGQAFGGVAMQVAAGGSMLDLMQAQCDR